MLAARRVRGDREVQNIGKRFCSCAWPPRVLVNRGEDNSFIVRYQCLGAVAMMRVKVPDRDPPNLLRRRSRWPRSGIGDAKSSKSIQCGHCNVAEITKPHRAFSLMRPPGHIKLNARFPPITAPAASIADPAD